MRQPGPNKEIIAQREKLQNLISTMNVPRKYREVNSKDQWWLLKNLGTRNKDHEKYDEAIKQLRMMLRLDKT